MKRVIATILLCLTLTGCNLGAGSDTHEPTYLYTKVYNVPACGVFKEENNIKIVYKFRNSLIIERTYIYDGDYFIQLVINIYPCKQFVYEDISAVTKHEDFEKIDGYYTATISDGVEVVSVLSMSRAELYDFLQQQYEVMTNV